MFSRKNLGGWLAGVGVVLFLGCAMNSYTPPLTKRGLPENERRDYIIQNGFGTPNHVKEGFLNGVVVDSMPREMVYHLFGAPDRAGERDSHWEYIDRRNNLIVGIFFHGDKISKIEGDPTGGAPAVKPATEDQ